MEQSQILDWKTGRLEPEFAKRSGLYLLMFLWGALFSLRAGNFQGYLHEFGHVAAATICGGQGEIINSHLSFVKCSGIVGPFMYSSGVGFVFLFYYVLSSKRTLGRFLVSRAFFTGIMLMELQGSYYSGGDDFDKSPMAAVLFTLTWVFLLYKRIRVQLTRDK